MGREACAPAIRCGATELVGIISEAMLVTAGDLRIRVTAGVGYRWQDNFTIGYRPVDTADPNVISFDLANPYMGPSEDAVGFWTGYSRKLTSTVNWKIQLNVRDAFSGNSLIPLTAQPDGLVEAWRIAPSRSWTITNTFSF